MSPVSLKKCNENDLDLLSEMFGHLVEDEKSDRVWTDEQRKEALHRFMSDGCKAYFFIDGEEILGYAIVNEKVSPPYLLHFFIRREHRRKHYGKVAFETLMRELGADTIDLDVYVWNSPGVTFWRSLGFKDRSMRMRYKAPESK